MTQALVPLPFNLTFPPSPTPFPPLPLPLPLPPLPSPPLPLPPLPSPSLLPLSGLQLPLELGGGEVVTVEALLDEVYQKASALRIWPLLRHTAGLLRKNVEDLAQVGSVCNIVHAPLLHKW